MTPSPIGQNLRRMRQARDLSQSELARRASLTPAAVWQIENGTRQPLSSTLSRLAAALEVSTDSLAGFKQQRTRASAYALAFAWSLPQLQQVAREHGYALGVHGSMQTDLDLIAAPWAPEAASPEVLIEALRVATNGHVFTVHGDGGDPSKPVRKPHGRLAWSIYLNDEGKGPYLDVSVMPRSPRQPELALEEN